MDLPIPIQTIADPGVKPASLPYVEIVSTS